ncbi:peptidoglycan-binding domain-containing protein [Nonomuraea sp. NPDC003804]|uniref:efflux RND transporter periplasmic adaptor subunit n=1 Tax=Nonomuraea sp. NPDC003804 TaxID=3154547 RepID=UPI0033ADF532
MTRAGRPRLWRAFGVVVVTAAALAVAVPAATDLVLDGPAQGGDRSGRSAGGLPPVTAKVTRQTLVDSQTENGELGYGAATTVNSRLSGTVTRLPATGTRIRRGQAVYRLDDTPVVLLYGTLPAYRALSAGVEGADVRRFEQNLHALGYRGFTVDDTYSAATAAAVMEWQDDLGLPRTGTVELGRVVYAKGAVRVDAHKAAAGDAVQPGAGVLTYTGTSRVVTVQLDVSEQRLAGKGATVNVTLPDGGKARGRIATTETVIDTGGNGSDEPTTRIDVTITIQNRKKLPTLDRASVDVAFSASKRESVLTVPVAALLALAEGGYGVQVVAGGTTRTVPVRTGLFAAGRVEVTGDGISEGVTVGMPA